MSNSVKKITVRPAYLQVITCIYSCITVFEVTQIRDIDVQKNRYLWTYMQVYMIVYSKTRSEIPIVANSGQLAVLR